MMKFENLIFDLPPDIKVMLLIYRVQGYNVVVFKKMVTRNDKIRIERIEERNDKLCVENIEARKLQIEDIEMKEGMRNPVCSNCGGPAALVEISIEERHLRIENARLTGAPS
ncbi:hypothetical protein ACH5RR_007316 [Cinchona calisaya]|uniref:Uncharacterized protein n=1 Tax=Cinchona calisaya TaxID=153742 RepID=A0ABD3ARK5_9GENT